MNDPVQNHHDHAVVGDASKAHQQGYSYRPQPYKPLYISEVVLVKKGAQDGRQTAGFMLEDAMALETLRAIIQQTTKPT
jgi:hypothetical protein